MTNSERVLELAKRNKILRAKDLSEEDIPSVYLTRLVESGDLERIGRGLYVLPEFEFDEKQSLLEVQTFVPKGVICLLSALSFHELTTQNPFEVWLAIERNAPIPKIDSLQLRIFRVSGEAFSEGIETHDIDGVELRVYSPAKTVVDCFKYRNKIGLDVAIEALRDTWRKRKATMDELWHFAKICNMTKVMRPFLESLV